MEQNYVVVKQEEMASQYGGTVIKITCVGTKDRFEYISYVDPRNRNVTNWWHIITHPTRGYILKNLRLKQTRDGKVIINADSDPIILAETEQASDLFRELTAVWREQDEDTPNQFRNLFD